MDRLSVCPLRQWAMTTPNAPVITLPQGEISFEALDQLVERAAGQFRADGFERGDRLGFVTQHPLATVVYLWACLRTGVVFCPINPAFPESQRQAYAQRIGAKAVLELFECEPLMTLELRQMLSIQIDSEALWDLVATSGTSGVPKAVAHCFRNHFYNAEGSLSTLPLMAGDRWLMSLPLFHVGGLAVVIRCVLAGATAVMFEQKLALDVMLQQQSVSHLSLVNTQLFRLLESGESLQAAGVRYILLGGGVASPTLVQRAQAQDITVLTTYGMTEMASQICTGVPQFVAGGVSSGAVLPYRELRIQADGAIQVRGETLALGYYDRGELIKLAGEDGWFTTGDRGAWHNDQLLVLGRRDNMLISGGENIHPEEIEQALLMLPEVVQAVVVPVEDAQFGQRPVAYVQTVDGQLDEAAMRQQLSVTLARFKLPVYIRRLPSDGGRVGIKLDRRYFQALANAQL